MDATKIEKLKKLLEEERTVITAELEHIAKPNPAIKDDWIAQKREVDASATLDEQAQSVTNWEQRRAIEQDLELRLKEIDLALEKINAGTYGTCVTCHEPIQERRLEAMPVSIRCINCSKKLEAELA